MRCEKVKDLIMTGYLDGELKSSLKKRVDEHLLYCQSCKAFAAQLKDTVIKPFKESTRLRPPQSVWEGVKAAISPQEEYKEGFLQRLRDDIAEIFTHRKPVFALATALTLVIAVFIFTKIPFNGKRATNNYLQEQIDFLTYLEVNEDYYSDNGYMDLDTAIEEYFL